jgi:hypothetical protein
MNIENLFNGTDGVLVIDQQFDAKLLRDEMTEILGESEAMDAWSTFSQLGLTHRVGIDPTTRYRDGCGSLYDKDTQKMLAETSQFSQLSTDKPYINQVIDVVREIANTYGRQVGRVRFMKQDAKTCLSLHRDLDEFRFHVPIQTFKTAFFIVDDVVCRMPREGNMYLLNTKVPHTAVNADYTKSRIHLLFDTY